MALTGDDKRWIEEHMNHIREDLEKVETRLLTEFHKWASTYEPRVRGVASLARTLDERMEALETRVSDLERRQ